MTLGEGWSYRPDDRYKPVARVLDHLVDVVSKGGNYLLNVGMAPDGVFPAEARRRLEEIGRWMRVNGEGIYGSRPVEPYASGSVRFTQRGEYRYAFVPSAACAGGTVSWMGHLPAPGSPLERLGAGPVPWRQESERLVATPVHAGDAPWVVLRFRPR